MAFNPKKFVAEQTTLVKKIVGARARAIIGVSGGVDSTTAAVLAHRVLGNRLHAVFVDTGFMREGEAKRTVALFKELGLRLHVVDAGEEFFSVIKSVTDPERKRKIIGEKFVEVFEREAKRVRAEFLLQGTIAPDWIESGSGTKGSRDRIKTHHNVGGLPEKMGLRVVEPLRDLYKDEVRLVARELGIPQNLFERQPFPGPGLAVRVLGEVTRERVAVCRRANAIVEEEVEASAAAGEFALPWQYFAVLLPVRSVGVQGDVRAYGETIVVRAVDSTDGMTAQPSRFPPQFLERLSARLSNELKEKINRVVFDCTFKPPGTIEWE
ncbi:MAG: glutamine-hydrolyzing GMP synthase [Candidatus Norongarragalinales archaeon]